MSGEPTLRDLRWQDLATLAALERDLFGAHAWSEATWWAELAGRPRRDYVVAAVGEGAGDGGPRGLGGPVVGYAGIDHGGEAADVMTLAVVAAYRGRGLGDRLVSDLLRRAEAAGATAVLLEVRADNGPALRLYARHGFEQVAVRRRYYQPGDVDALVLRRRGVGR